MLGIEPLDRLDQAEGGHLHEVVEGDAAVLEPAGEVGGQPEVGGHQLVPDRRVPRPPVGHEPLEGGGAARIVARHG